MKSALLALTLALPATALAGESFRCGQWIVTDEFSVSELVAKCGEPATKTSEEVEVRGKVGTGSVSRGTTVIEHWTYVLSSGAHYEIKIVDGDIQTIARVK
jgi:hypothetical protein